MEMTKERLAAYRSMKQEIAELQHIIDTRWESEEMLGNDVIFDYCKGYPMPQSVVGFDQKRYERLQERDLRRIQRLEEECAAIESFISDISDSLTRRIFQMYFLEGEKKPSQGQIAQRVHLDRSSASKKIYGYLQVSHNSQKSQL